MVPLDNSTSQSTWFRKPRSCLQAAFKEVPQDGVGLQSPAVTHCSCLPHGTNDKTGRGQTRDAAGKVKKAADTTHVDINFLFCTKLRSRFIVDCLPMRSTMCLGHFVPGTRLT